MNILVTSGGTSEKIDNVRKITNSSTGKLGCTIAEAFAVFEDVEKIWYICGENAPVPQCEKVEIITIESTEDLLKAALSVCGRNIIDAVVHAMAVSDYYVKKVSTIELISESVAEQLHEMDREALRLFDGPRLSLRERLFNAVRTTSGLNIYSKISSDKDGLVLFLDKTPKVLPYFRGMLPLGTIVGFKLLDSVDREFLISNAYQLLIQNNCDFVLANDLSEVEAVKHVGHLIDRNQTVVTYNTKAEIAEGIAKAVLEYHHAPDQESDDINAEVSLPQSK